MSLRPLAKEIEQQTHYLLSRHYDVVFCWTPGHVGIVGNELADQAAKSATQKTNVDIQTVPVWHVQSFIKRSILQAWQTEWQGTNFKLTTAKDSVRPWSSSFRSVRREENILTRLWIGHSFFSHSFLLRLHVKCVEQIYLWSTSFCNVQDSKSFDNNTTWQPP